MDDLDAKLKFEVEGSLDIESLNAHQARVVDRVTKLLTHQQAHGTNAALTPC